MGDYWSNHNDDDDDDDEYKLDDDADYWCNQNDDDDDDDDDEYKLYPGDDGREPFLPSITESMRRKRTDGSRGKLAYTKYCCRKRTYEKYFSDGYDEWSDPLKNLVLLNGHNATRLANDLAQRDTLRVLKIFLGALTIRGAKGLGEAVASRPKLTHLTIRRISDEQTPAVLRSLCSEIAQSLSVEKLSLQSNNNDLNLKLIVSSLRSLASLYIRGVCHFPSLCEGISLSLSLSKLEITQTQLSPDQLRALSLILPQCKTLITLNLACTELNDSCLRALLENWTPETSIEELNLSWNQLTGQGAVLLLRAAATLPFLKTLKLNRSLTTNRSDIEMIGNELASNHFLRKLDIRNCRTYGCVKNNELEPLTEGIKGSQSLGYFVCGRWSNEVDKWYDQESVQWYLGLNRHGRRLFTTHHELASTVWCRILEKCGKEKRTSAVSLIYYFLREQPHLVQEGKRPKRKKARRRLW